VKPPLPSLEAHLRAIDTHAPLPRFIRQLFAAAAFLQVERASAQSISPDPSGSGVIADAVNWLTGTLLGNVATGIAILAVAIIAILLMTGRIEWGRAALVVIGIFVLFGAVSIVSGIRAITGTA
jgi:type IV secretory pathway VirB2 component (pilin)